MSGVTYSSYDFSNKLGVNISMLSIYTKKGMPCIKGMKKRDGNAYNPGKCYEWAVKVGDKRLTERLYRAYPVECAGLGLSEEQQSEVKYIFKHVTKAQAKAASRDSLNYPPKFSDESTAPEPVCSPDLLHELDRLFNKFVKDAGNVLVAFAKGKL